jgi:hypothetical protein
MRYENSPHPQENLFTMESYGPEDDKSNKKKREHKNKK